MITALARMNGKVVGIIANNPMFGGIVDVKAARKQGHFTELCDMFNIPLVFFCRRARPPWSAANRRPTAILREGVRARYIGLQVGGADVHGDRAQMLRRRGRRLIDRGGLNFKIAWPSAEWGSLPIEGGVKAAYRREIESAPDPAAREKRNRSRTAAAGLAVSHGGSLRASKT